MRAYEVHTAFGLDNLRQTERPDLEPGPGEVLVRLRAASLNYRDLLMVRGEYNPRQRLPFIPCSDGAGEVAGVGEGVTAVSVGDRVTPIFAQAWQAGEPRRDYVRSTLGGPLDGTLAEQIVVGEQGLVRAPAHLSDAEAACLPCAALTAWSCLVAGGGLRPGETVLVQGTGGVALFAIQFARFFGARVFATSSSDARLERALALGASEGINYRTTPEWGRAARQLSGGRGVDVVVEVGGAGTLQQSLAAVRTGGRISLIGVLAGSTAPLDVRPLFMQQVRVQGVLVGHRQRFEKMLAAVEEHGVHPVIHRRFPFAGARQAFDQMAAGGHFGKLVVEIR